MHVVKKNLVGVLYRPLQSKVEYWDNFQTNVHKAIDLNLPIFLLGDFNVNMLSQQNNSFWLNLTNIIFSATYFTSNIGISLT